MTLDQNIGKNILQSLVTEAKTSFAEKDEEDMTDAEKKTKEEQDKAKEDLLQLKKNFASKYIENMDASEKDKVNFMVTLLGGLEDYLVTEGTIDAIKDVGIGKAIEKDLTNETLIKLNDIKAKLQKATTVDKLTALQNEIFPPTGDQTQNNKIDNTQKTNANTEKYKEGDVVTQNNYISFIEQKIINEEARGDKYSAINLDDAGKGPSFGLLQRHGDRAKDLFKKMYNEHPTEFTTIMTSDFVQKIDTNKIWDTGRKTGEFAKFEAPFKALMTDQKFQKIMDQQLSEDIKGYVETRKTYGITDPTIMVYVCRLENMGHSRAERLMNRVTKPYTLDKIHTEAIKDNHITSNNIDDDLESFKSGLLANNLTNIDINTLTV